ncbi:MAG: alpha-mannosidase [Candidatus Saccharimonadales bacterium]
MNGSEGQAKARAQTPIHFEVTRNDGIHYDLDWVLSEDLSLFDFQSLMGEVITRLENNPRQKWNLDGQSALAEWILRGLDFEENVSLHQRLSRLVHMGQLEIGLGYVVPEFFLAPPMALVQNYRIGHEVAASFADEFLADDEKVPRIVDTSDSFGLNEQLAQIAAPFADVIRFSRGQYRDQIGLIIGRLFAPNGSSIVAIPQQGGYQSWGDFGRFDLATSLKIAKDFFDKYLPRYQAAGVRHVEVSVRRDFKGLPPHLDEHWEAVKQLYPHISFTTGGNVDYVEKMKQYITDDLPEIHGELAGSAERIVLRDVSSSRMQLKLRSFVITKAFLDTDAVASLALLKLGKAYYYPRHEMLRRWKKYLERLSHDAITGCNSDQVTRDILADFIKIEEVLDRIKQKALAALAGHEAKHNHDNRIGRAPTREFGLMNLSSLKRTDEVVLVPLPPKLRGHRILRAWVGPNQANRVPVKIQRTANDCAAIPVSTGSFGSVSVLLEQNTHAEEVEAPDELGVIENERLRVKMELNGTLTILDKLTGQLRKGLHRFESEGEGGDTYTCAPVTHRFYDSRGEYATVKHLSNGPLVWEMEIGLTLHVPKRLHRRDRNLRVRTTAVEINTLVRLHRGSRQVEFDTKVVNTAEDHRLRVIFPTGEKVSASRAQIPFMVKQYPVREPVDPKWREQSEDKEPPFSAITNQGLVIVGSVFSANRGITAYEARSGLHGTELCLTLLRCVSHLSQGELSSRRGQAGPGNVSVPMAQCQGKFDFSYTLGVVDNETDIELAQAAQAWRNGFEPTFANIDTNGLLEVVNGQADFVSLMPTRDSKAVELISYAGSEPASVEITGAISSVERVDLAGKSLPVQSSDLEPYGIEVFRLNLRS